MSDGTYDIQREVTIGVKRPQDTAGTYYYHNDHLGTPQALTDNSQTVVWQASYTPFGEAAISTDIVENNIRFPGQYYDQESRLHYNYFRDYDPQSGRYIQSDRLGLFDGPNTYGYAHQNPISKYDPTGEFAWGVAFAVLDLGLQLYQNGGNLDCVNWTEVGLSAVGGGLLNAFKVAKIHKIKKTLPNRGNSHSWKATRNWYAKNVNKDIPKGEHIHHWLVERKHFEGNKALEKIFNQPWNLNPKPFTNLYHNTKVHNNGLIGWLNGTPTWAREVAGGSALAIAAGGE